MATDKPKAYAGKTVKPENISTLRTWVNQWPKANNLAFDPEERNPVIYSQSDSTKAIKKIEWRREADTLTVLTQRESFGTAAVGAAERRMGKIREDREAAKAAAEEQIRLAEAAVLDAWRAYRGAAGTAGGRDSLMQGVVQAEKTLQELEAVSAPADRKKVMVGELTGVQIPAVPYALRGMPLTEVE